MTRFSRRTFLAGGAAALLPLAPPRGLGGEARLRETRAGAGATLRPAPRPVMLGDCSGPTGTWRYTDEIFPVLRARKSEELQVTLENRLSEHTSIHWHGVRVPNAMDGVPYVTQLPVNSGERFVYRFAPPDAGTFFFHPHCNTAEQLGRGLAGALVVDGDETEPFDADIICILKDWRVAPDGAFLPFITTAEAGRAGSFGTLRTANGLVAPEIAVPAGADIRLRLVNADSTRIGEIGIEGGAAHVIAIDANAVEPFALESWRLGPAMRVDLALRTPERGTVRVLDYFAPEPVTLATLAVRGAPKHAAPFRPFGLRPNALPEPDLASAARHTLALSASAVASTYDIPPPITLADGRRIDLMDALCASPQTLWAIDGKTWPERGHERLPPPLLDLRLGQSVVLTLANLTPHPHPMHLHGHSFKVLSANRLARPVHWADTVLVMPNERVEIAFVADNPGNWMLHCHIIEHQDTGMMGWFRVS